MTRQSEHEQQRILRAASTAFYEALPPMHRELVALMAADAGKEPYAIIAHAIEAQILLYREGLLPLRRVTDPRNRT